MTVEPRLLFAVPYSTAVPIITGQCSVAWLVDNAADDKLINDIIHSKQLVVNSLLPWHILDLRHDLTLCQLKIAEFVTRVVSKDVPLTLELSTLSFYTFMLQHWRCRCI